MHSSRMRTARSSSCHGGVSTHTPALEQVPPLEQAPPAGWPRHRENKTGNLVLTFSRQGKHREFCFGTGKNFETQGKYFSVTQGKF